MGFSGDDPKLILILLLATLKMFVVKYFMG